MYLLFDIGGSHMRFTYSTDGTSINKESIEVYDTPDTFKEGVQKFEKACSELNINKDEIGYVSGGIAGTFGKQKKKLVSSPNLPQWEDKPLEKQIFEVLDAEVFIDNDTVMGGLGEANEGAGKDYDIVAYIAFGTGIGGAKISKGKPDSHMYGFEPGHQIIKCEKPSKCGLSPESGYGKFGHWESLAGGWAIEEKYSQRASELTREQCEKIMDWISLGLTNITLLWSPEVFVLGGGIIADDVFNLDYLEESVSKRLNVFPEPPKVKKARLGDYSGLHGAMSYCNIFRNKND
ncbi:MAG: ROK family protein [Candidatus Magasanikbacteria bacterium]